MKIIYLFITLSLIGCSQNCAELTTEQKERIKKEIILSYEKHAKDLQNLNYKEIVKYYANVEDQVLYADGFYEGNYQFIDGMWKWVVENVKDIYLWEARNKNVCVFSEKSAIYLFEFYSERIQANGDTVKVQGAFSHGMQKFTDGWKIVTTQATHNYVEGYGLNPG